MLASWVQSRWKSCCTVTHPSVDPQFVWLWNVQSCHLSTHGSMKQEEAQRTSSQHEFTETLSLSCDGRRLPAASDSQTHEQASVPLNQWEHFLLVVSIKRFNFIISSSSITITVHYNVYFTSLIVFYLILLCLIWITCGSSEAFLLNCCPSLSSLTWSEQFYLLNRWCCAELNTDQVRISVQ